jgi:hypothetical protein
MPLDGSATNTIRAMQAEVRARRLTHFCANRLIAILASPRCFPRKRDAEFIYSRAA